MRIRRTFTVVVESQITKADLVDAGEILELGRPATHEEFLQCERDRMEDDGLEYLDCWMSHKNTSCHVELKEKA